MVGSMNHSKIKFKRIVAPLMPPQQSDGILVGQYLVVSYAGSDPKSGYAIYNTSGRRLFPVTYTSYDATVKLAETLEAIYGYFFPIWEIWPEADIFALARWSVADGHRIYEQLTG